MSCENCKDEHHNSTVVPYIVHEADMARMERTNRRLWVLVILLLVIVIALIGGVIWYESQFETVTETTTQEVWQDAEYGGNRFIGGDVYGETVR